MDHWKSLAVLCDKFPQSFILSSLCGVLLELLKALPRQQMSLACPQVAPRSLCRFTGSLYVCMYVCMCVCVCVYVCVYVCVCVCVCACDHIGSPFVLFSSIEQQISHKRTARLLFGDLKSTLISEYAHFPTAFFAVLCRFLEGWCSFVVVVVVVVVDTHVLGVGTVSGLLAARWKSPGSIVGRGKIFSPNITMGSCSTRLPLKRVHTNFLSPNPEGV